MVTPPGGTDSSSGPAGQPQGNTRELEELGSRIFQDPGLSLRRNQSCASCHDELFGFTAPDAEVNAGGGVMAGSVPERFGERRPPSVAYATASPVLHWDDADSSWVGGNFWDGRATGSRLGTPTADQAQVPLLDTLEMAVPDAACVIYRVTTGPYSDRWVDAWGRDAFSIHFPSDVEQLCGQPGATVPLTSGDRDQVEREFDHVALSLAAFEASAKVNPFSSKFDAWKRGHATLTPEEQRGLALFEGKARCAACHASQGTDPLFTDYGYDNNGVPPNPENPALLADPSFRDPGLGGFLRDPSFLGFHKVPTLRNVDRRPYPDAPKSYMHNGVFKSLEEVVHFYNTRDVLPRCGTGGTSRPGVDCWPAPEVEQNVNREDMGDLGLTPEEEAAIVAYLKTLTDGYMPAGSR